MSNFESSKNYAGIGAILLIFTPIPAAGLVIGIVGAVLLLMGMKGIADHYQDQSIYQNALMGIIYLIIGIVATFAIILGFVLGSIFVGLFALGLLLVALVVGFVFYVLGAYSFRKAFSSITQRSGEHMFETAGLILLIGAFLTIVLVGLLLVLIAWILVAIAFFSMKLPATQPTAYTPPPAAPAAPVAAPSQSAPPPVAPSPPPAASPMPVSIPPAQASRYCPNCGASVDPTVTFCPRCGQRLPPP